MQATDIKVISNPPRNEDIPNSVVTSIAKALLSLYNANPEHWNKVFSEKGIAVPES